MNDEFAADLIVSYPENLPEQIKNAIFSDLGEHGRLKLHPREIGPTAGLGWLLGSAFILWIAKPFVEGFLNEAGKDSYVKFSRSVSQLTSDLLSDPIFTPVSSQKHKLGDIHERSLGFSLLVELSGDLNAKFIFREKLSEDQYRDQIDEVPFAVSVLSEGLEQGTLSQIRFGYVYLEYFDAWQIIDVDAELAQL